MSQAELREELQHITLRLQARTSQITADLIVGQRHFDPLRICRNRHTSRVLLKVDRYRGRDG
jgi:hypothetical protein